MPTVSAVSTLVYAVPTKVVPCVLVLSVISISVCLSEIKLLVVPPVYSIKSLSPSTIA
jgi:hypothetical protein